VVNTYYYIPKINQLPSGTTVYFRIMHHNALGIGSTYTTNYTTQDSAHKISEKGQGYATDQYPIGTFSSGGYQWEKTASYTVDLVKTFSYTQNTGEDPNQRADSFVVVVTPGGGTPDPTTDKTLVFPVTHLTGSQDYELRVPNLDPFTTYSFRVYQAKNTASGLSLNTSSSTGRYLTDTDLCYEGSTGHLYLTTPTAKESARVIVKGGGGYAGVKMGNTYTTPNYYGIIELVNSSGNAFLTLKNNGASSVIDAGGTNALSIVASTVTMAAALEATGLIWAQDDLEVTGEARCDTLRIDATPATGTITPDKVIEVNMNGTIYQIPVKAKP